MRKEARRARLLAGVAISSIVAARRLLPSYHPRLAQRPLLRASTSVVAPQLCTRGVEASWHTAGLGASSRPHRAPCPNHPPISALVSNASPTRSHGYKSCGAGVGTVARNGAHNQAFPRTPSTRPSPRHTPFPQPLKPNLGPYALCSCLCSPFSSVACP